MIRILFVLSLTFLIAGCESAPPQHQAPPPGALLGEQLKRQDEKLIGQRFRTLLDFEHDADAVFVKSELASVTSVAAHTGAQALRIEGNTAIINIDPLLYGKPMSDDWTLLGAYLRLGAPGRVNTSLLADDEVVSRTERDTSPDIWLFAAVDMTDDGVRKRLQSAKHIQLRIDVASSGFLMDDVLLVNNERSLVPSAIEEVPKWTIEQRGLSIDVDADGRFKQTVPSTLARPDGWSEDEVNDIRVRFSGGGETRKSWVLYCDGRSIENGKMSILGGDAAGMQKSHDHPGEIVVDETLGRLDRNTAGDADNDGYNEQRGAYQIVAQGTRLAWKVVPPPETPIASPVFEIKNLPGDTFSVMVEGRLFKTACRVSPDTVLLILPITIEKPTEIVLRASNNRMATSAEPGK